MTEILFDNILRGLELLVRTQSGDVQRGRLNLTQISREADDFILHGTGASSGQEHSFALSQVQEIIDLESGEQVSVPEFRAELDAHPRMTDGAP